MYITYISIFISTGAKVIWQKVTLLSSKCRMQKKCNLVDIYYHVMVVSYRLHIVTTVPSLTIRPQFAIEYLWCSNQHGVGHIWQNLERKGLTNFNTTWRRHVAVVCKRNHVNIYCLHNARIWQIDRQTDHRMVTSIAIGEITCQQCCPNNTITSYQNCPVKQN